MEFPKPVKDGFTVYSKSGCHNCTKVKALFKDKQITCTVIDCDDLIIEHKADFLLFIQQLINKEYKMFPMVFDNSKFIGGYTETVKYLDELLDFDMSF